MKVNYKKPNKGYINEPTGKMKLSGPEVNYPKVDLTYCLKI